MGLAEIADGLCVTTEQRERGVAVADETAVDLTDRLADYADGLPCPVGTAAAVVDAYVGGRAVDAAAHDAGVAPTTAAKVLHLLGLSGVSPVSPQGRELVRDWLDGELSRAEARALSGASEREFALAAYVESHEPLAGGADVVADEFARDADASVTKRDALAGTMSDADEFL